MNGLFIFKDIDNQVDKPWNLWTKEEKKKAQNDYVAKNILTSELNMNEFFRISQCNSAKYMWDELEVTHEGSNDVKRVRKHALIQEYKWLKMQQGESIYEVHKRLTHIVNHLTDLEK